MLFLDYEIAEMAEHEVKMATEEFLKSNDVKIKKMMFHHSNEVYDKYIISIR